MRNYNNNDQLDILPAAGGRLGLRNIRRSRCASARFLGTAAATGLILPSTAQANWGQVWGDFLWATQATAEVPIISSPWMYILLIVSLMGIAAYALRHRRSAVAPILIVGLALPIIVHAAQVTLPFEFTNGTEADATQVNANFDALTSESNQQDLRLELIEDDTTSNTGRISTLEAEIISLGDITGVTAGAGLSGGGTSGDVSLSADLAALQARVTGTCPAGSAMRIVDGAGGVTCQNAGIPISTGDARYVNVTGDTLTGQLNLPGGTSFFTDGAARFANGDLWISNDGRLGFGAQGFGDAILTTFDTTGKNWFNFHLDSASNVRFTLSTTGSMGLNQQAFPDALISGVSRAGDSWLYFFRDADSNIVLTANTSGDINSAGQISAQTLNATTEISANTFRIRGGADIAEPFDVSGESVAPGMVVAIDTKRAGRLRLSDAAYDRTVAGIVSGAGGIHPGLTLSQDGSIATGEHPVALTGRVYAWVDADANGPIRPGDMLTTSATPGHAMRATDPSRSFGSTIGKAMGSLESGKGLVLTLVNLQ